MVTARLHSPSDLFTGLLTDLSPTTRADLLATLATKALEEATTTDEHGVYCDTDEVAETVAWLLPLLAPRLSHDDYSDLWNELKYSLQTLHAALDIDTSRLEPDLRDQLSYRDACVERVRGDLSALVGTSVHWHPDG